MVLDSNTDKPCMLDMHHMKALDALGRLLHRAYRGRGRHHGSIQLVWCAHQPTEQSSGWFRSYLVYVFSMKSLFSKCLWWFDELR